MMDDMTESELSLINSFNCLNTSDKEDLVRELIRLVGPSISTNGAWFFLDMNNWNLPLAINSYYDLTNDTVRLSSELLPSSNENLSVPKNTHFTICWSIRNNGVDPWPPGTTLKCKTQPHPGHQDSNPFQAGPHLVNRGELVEAGTLLNIPVPLVSPSESGLYEVRWSLCSPEGYYFGEEIIAVISITEDLSELETGLQNMQC